MDTLDQRKLERRHTRYPGRKTAQPMVLRAVDLGLLAVLVLTPVVLGGRIAAGRLAFVAAAVWTAVAWCLYQYSVAEPRWRRSGAYWLLLATLCTGLLQVVPLPEPLLHLLSPNLAQRLPLWFSEPGEAIFGTWRTISLTPDATWTALSLIAAFGLVFAVVVQRIETGADIERFLRAMGFLAAAMALFALVQFFASNGKYFWFYEHPFARTDRTIVGTFTNRNHFAQFIALGLGPLIWCLQTALRRRNHARSRSVAAGSTTRGERGERGEMETVFWGVALAVALFAGLMSLSRGGALAAGAAVSVSLLISFRGGLIGRRTALGIASAAVLLAAALSVWGYPMLAARLDDFASIDDLNNGGRLELWQGDSKGIAASWLAGHGLGSHRHVSPTYYANEATAAGIEYTHAESGYVQVPFEGGLAGGVLLAAAMGFCGYWCAAPLARRLKGEETLVLAAIAPAFAASFVHAVGDFIWYVPGCTVPLAFFAAAACRFHQMTRPEADHPEPARIPSTPVWVAGAAAVAVFGGVVLLTQYRQCRAETRWNEYLAVCRRISNEDLSREEIAARAKLLYEVTKWEPRHAAAHASLAKLHLKSFNDPAAADAVRMDERHIRETVLASKFADRETMREWLARAFEDRVTHLDAAWYHLRAALNASPSLGDMYVLAGSLAFLETPTPPPTSAFLGQAVLVRPGDGDVLFAVGQEEMLSGDLEGAIEFYRRAAQTGKAYQKQVFAWLASVLPAEAVIEIVRPDVDGLQTLRRSYAAAQRPDQFAAIDERIVAAAEEAAVRLSGSDAAIHWIAAGRAAAALGRKDDAARCYRAAVDADATDRVARESLAAALVDRADYEEAQKHLRWCLQRKPNDTRLKALLEAAVEGSLRKPLETARKEEAIQ